MKIKTYGLLFVLVAINSISSVSADVGDNNLGGCWGGMMYGSYGTGMALFGWLFMILVIIALIIFIIWMIKQLQKNSEASKRK